MLWSIWPSAAVYMVVLTKKKKCQHLISNTSWTVYFQVPNSNCKSHLENINLYLRTAAALIKTFPVFIPGLFFTICSYWTLFQHTYCFTLEYTDVGVMITNPIIQCYSEEYGFTWDCGTFQSCFLMSSQEFFPWPFDLFISSLNRHSDFVMLLDDI